MNSKLLSLGILLTALCLGYKSMANPEKEAICTLTFVDHIDNTCHTCPGTGVPHTKMYISAAQSPAVFLINLSQPNSEFNFELQCSGERSDNACTFFRVANSTADNLTKISVNSSNDHVEISTAVHFTFPYYDGVSEQIIKAVNKAQLVISSKKKSAAVSLDIANISDTKNVVVTCFMKP